MPVKTAAQSYAVTLRLGHLGIALATDAPDLARAVHERYGGFTGQGDVDARLKLNLAPAKPHDAGNYQTASRLSGTRLQLQSPVLSGDFDLSTRRGELTIAPHPRFGAAVYLENALRQIAQVVAVKRAAFFLHAAGVAPGADGPVRVFTGRSGSGKTTMAGLLAQTGGRVLSDDLILLRVSGDGVYAGTTPFFGTLRETVPPPENVRCGLFPVSSVYVLEKCGQCRTYNLPDLSQAAAFVLANVPFTECFDQAHQQGLLDHVMALVAQTPVMRLGFRKDLTFLPLIGWPPVQAGLCPEKDGHGQER